MEINWKRPSMMVLETCMHAMQEDGWVVCRVFKKKSIQRGLFDDQLGMAPAAGDDDELHSFHSPGGMTPVEQKHGLHLHQLMHGGVPAFDPSMHLPHLTTAEGALGAPSFTSGTSAVAMNLLDMGCSPHNMVKMTTSCGSASDMPLNSGERFGAAADWSILDKLLASHQNLDQLFHCKLGGTTLAVPHHYQQQQMQQQHIEMSTSSLLH
jgi:hypothetical protein